MGAHWKREKVQDHKFDFINVDDFIDNSCWRQFRYMVVFLIIIRGILVYCSDIFTAVNLWTNKNPNSFIEAKNGQLDLGIGGIKLSMEVYKYLFTGCIVLGLLLLALDIRRANGIIASRDISYAFTSQIAARYYTVRSYPHYCFFAEIDNSKKFVDNVAFFVFFTFRNWKRLLLADAPRQLINMTMLYQVFKSHLDSTFFEWDDYIGNRPEDIFKKIALGAMMFTVTVFVFNMLSFIAAVCMYIPLVSHIQGNLKEYCCYKIDKRIEELIKKNTKNRANAAAKSKGSKDIAMDYMGKPTLPQVDIMDSAPTPAAPPPRNPYNKGGYGHQQQDYDYGYNTQPSGGYNPSPQQAGYTQNYGNEDYFQAKPVYNNNNSSSKGNYQQQRGGGGGGGKAGDGGFDPYAESAFTTEDAYDQHSGTGSHDQLHSQKSRDNYYNNAAQTPRVGGNSGGGGGKFDDYSHLRSASPLPSQHGSDLDSNHYSNHSGGYGHGGSGYNNNSNSNNGGYYRNDSYSTTYGNNGGGGGGTPQRPRRNDQGSNYRNY